MKKLLLVTLFSLLACFATLDIASAISISVYDDIPDHTYISAGGNLSGSFDINPAIPTNGDYIIPYDVESAQYTFRFTDDGDAQYNGTSTGSYRYYYSYRVGNAWTGYHYVTIYNRYQYDYYYDTSIERVRLSVAGEYSLDGGTTWNTMEEYDGTNLDYSNDYYRYYTYNYDVNLGYNGQFTLTGYLGNNALTSLSESGIVDFSMLGLAGDFYYESGVLDAEINPNPVPEPATMLLLGMGLVGLAGLGRKKAESSKNGEIK